MVSQLISHVSNLLISWPRPLVYNIFNNNYSYISNNHHLEQPGLRLLRTESDPSSVCNRPELFRVSWERYQTCSQHSFINHAQEVFFVFVRNAFIEVNLNPAKNILRLFSISTHSDMAWFHYSSANPGETSRNSTHHLNTNLRCVVTSKFPTLTGPRARTENKFN